MLLLVGCGSGIPGAVPSVSGTFVMPTPTKPSGTGFSAPEECRARGGDRVTVLKCTTSYVEQMFAQAYEPVVTERGFAWVPPKIVHPDSSADTACGKLSRPSYCPADQTLVMPLNSMTSLGNKAEQYLLPLHDQWDQLGLSAYKSVPKASLEANDEMYGAIAAFAHESAHHVQNLVGGEARISALEKAHPGSKAVYSSAIELHADCLAGWASKVNAIDGVTVQDAWSVLTMLMETGDDFAAATAGKPVDRSTFQHGSIAERYNSFRSGFRLADTSRDPWSGCEDVVVKTLTARGASPATSTAPAPTATP
ncbi:MAG: neutral zinc metallopeptidase [Actinomycetes bacterium]